MKATLQHIFDLGWNHFIEGDGQPAVDGDNGCCHLDSRGNKCVVGLAIPDGHKAQTRKGRFATIASEFPDLFDLEGVDPTTAEGRDYLNSFQSRLHDGLLEGGEWAFSKEQRRAKYIAVAREYNLKCKGK